MDRFLSISDEHLCQLLDFETKLEEKSWLCVEKDLKAVGDEVADGILDDLMGELARDLIWVFDGPGMA